LRRLKNEARPSFPNIALHGGTLPRNLAYAKKWEEGSKFEEWADYDYYYDYDDDYYLIIFTIIYFFILL
jgi:hypothetical protein